VPPLRVVVLAAIGAPVVGALGQVGPPEAGDSGLRYDVNMSTSGVVSVRLPDRLKRRLDALSAATGRPAAFYVREALDEHLDALEHAYTLRAEAEAVRRGAPTVSHADLKAELGLA
jgi:RHH-type rel operon transcriptional repressor/antitoxin RelB